MIRGDIITVAAGSGYGAKPRPAVIIRSDDFAATASVTVCLLTSRDLGTPLLRLPVLPTDGNRLSAPSWIMVDKILTVPRGKIGSRMGALATTDLDSLNRALAVFLGLAG